MKSDHIYELVKILPDAPAEPDRHDLVRSVHNIHPFDKDDLVSALAFGAKAQSNVQFQYLFAVAHANSGLALPAHLDAPWINRIYSAVTIPGWHDYHVIKAILLYMRNLHSTSFKLNALIIGDAPVEVMANLCDCDEETIEVYEHLFFDLRDRLRDQMLITDILNPICLAEDEAARVSGALHYMRIAHSYGWETACDSMGLKIPGRRKKPTAEVLEEYKHLSTEMAKQAILGGSLGPAFFAHQMKAWISAKTMATAAGLGGEDETNRMAAVAGSMLASEVQTQTKARLAKENSAKII